MAKRKAKPKGAHKMPGGAMMKDSEMKGMTKGAKPKFGTPEFFASLKKGKPKAARKPKAGRRKGR